VREILPKVKGYLKKIPLVRRVYQKYYWPAQFYFREHLKRKQRVEYPYNLSNIELTNQCLMKCVMCPRTYSMTRAQGLMSFSIFQKVVDEYAADNPAGLKSSEVWLQGFGESLLHPAFDRFIAYGVGKGLKICLSLNPIMLDEERSHKLLQANPYLLYLSIDGHDDKTFAKIRGLENSYEPSVQRVKDFLALKERLNSKTRVKISMIDFAINKSSIAQSRDFWMTQAGVDEFLAKEFVTWNGSIESINEFAGDKNPYGLTIRQRAGRRFAYCQFPFRLLTVLWDGSVVPCCYDYDAKLILGNVNDESLAVIWNNERTQHLRKSFMHNQVNNCLCKYCAYL
jgi:radical SAM protein with 4Fe4S-binding SPASM domain